MAHTRCSAKENLLEADGTFGPNTLRACSRRARHLWHGASFCCRHFGAMMAALHLIDDAVKFRHHDDLMREFLRKSSAAGLPTKPRP